MLTLYKQKKKKYIVKNKTGTYGNTNHFDENNTLMVKIDAMLLAVYCL